MACRRSLLHAAARARPGLMIQQESYVLLCASGQLALATFSGTARLTRKFNAEVEKARSVALGLVELREKEGVSRTGVQIARRASSWGIRGESGFR